MAHKPAKKREDAILEIVNQLNPGAALVTARDEREQLAELNLIGNFMDPRQRRSFLPAAP